MKNLIILFLAFAAFNVNAQIANVKMKTAAGVDSAIVTNTGSGSVVYALSSKQPFSVQANFVKTSGTLGGTVTIYGSNDGTNYFALTDATSTPTITTYTVTDAGTYASPQIKAWFLKDHPVKYLKITWAGTGTMAGYFKAWLLAY
ncbi:MAG TPA: hypothetical protein VL443_29955 [Cyclobacteriaceae bacterium]|jgi:hypothetical protein|nr:hypothetical protein [Cyclobacteriaceae bacterium]